MRPAILFSFATTLHTSNVLTGDEDIFQLVASYAGACTIPVLRQVSSTQNQLLSQEWVQANIPPITLTEEQMEALAVATSQEADAILGPYIYANADAMMNRLADLFFSDQDCREACPHLPAILMKLGQHGGCLARKYASSQLEALNHRLDEYPEQWKAFVYLAFHGFFGDPSERIVYNTLANTFIHFFSLESLEEALKVPSFLVWIKACRFAGRYAGHRIEPERARVLAAAVGFLLVNGVNTDLLTTLLGGCDAEHAREYVKVFLAHPHSRQYNWNVSGATALNHLAKVPRLPLKTFSSLVQAGADMFKMSPGGLTYPGSPFQNGLQNCADPSAFIELALEQGATEHLNLWTANVPSALYFLYQNEEAKAQDFVRLIQAGAKPEETTIYVEWGEVPFEEAFAQKFGTSLSTALSVDWTSAQRMLREDSSSL